MRFWGVLCWKVVLNEILRCPMLKSCIEWAVYRAPVGDDNDAAKSAREVYIRMNRKDDIKVGGTLAFMRFLRSCVLSSEQLISSTSPSPSPEDFLLLIIVSKAVQAPNWEYSQQTFKTAFLRDCQRAWAVRLVSCEKYSCDISPPQHVLSPHHLLLGHHHHLLFLDGGWWRPLPSSENPKRRNHQYQKRRKLPAGRGCLCTDGHQSTS